MRGWQDFFYTVVSGLLSSLRVQAQCVIVPSRQLHAQVKNRRSDDGQTVGGHDYPSELNGMLISSIPSPIAWRRSASVRITAAVRVSTPSFS